MGIIPAYAGSTSKCQTRLYRRRDHPRIRGEHVRGHVGVARQRGDHPRIRGEHLERCLLDSEDEGIIPAYAGSTMGHAGKDVTGQGSSPHTRGAQRNEPHSHTLSWDHPRIRGEHLGLGGAKMHRVGIIPAYAGSTWNALRDGTSTVGSSPHTRGARATRCSLDGLCRDHPRIRGEHDSVLRKQRQGDGIIPAYAGSTMMSSGRTPPRQGSSPHTRGAPRRRLTRSGLGRDHPRIRGEHPN